MSLRKVINIFGGPGVGKSTIATGLFYEMKRQGYNVEYVTEYAKQLTYDERFNVLEQDQLYIFAKQHRKIYRLREKCDYIITDSPLILSILYFRLNPGISFYNEYHLEGLIEGTFNHYPNMNIILNRNDRYKYQEEGRNQNEDGAKEIDRILKHLLLSLNIPHELLLSGDTTVNHIMRMVKHDEKTV